MPLNINDPQEPPNTDPQRPQPILRGPLEESKPKKKGIMVLFGLIVLGSAVFLIYLFSFLNPRRQGASPEIQSTGEPSVLQSRPNTTESSPTEFSEKQSPQTGAPFTRGRYTIYIASYADRAFAEEEVGRWNEAGFQSFVIEATGHYRVALGEYIRISEARSTAEHLNEAFENGYWIGVL